MDRKLIVRSELKDRLKARDVRVASAVYDELESAVERIIDRASDRAKLNGRATVMPQDI